MKMNTHGKKWIHSNKDLLNGLKYLLTILLRKKSSPKGFLGANTLGFPCPTAVHISVGLHGFGTIFPLGILNRYDGQQFEPMTCNNKNIIGIQNCLSYWKQNEKSTMFFPLCISICQWYHRLLSTAVRPILRSAIHLYH